jgi:hypothetical protein
MSLFSSKDVVVEMNLDTQPVMENELVSDSVLIGNSETLIADLYAGDFNENECISYMSNGNWSMYHLADFILNKIGPCEVHIATWSISELSARMLTQWLDTGRISSLNALFDFRSKNRHPAAFHLAKHNFSKVKLGLCHAKVSVFVSEDKYITVNGSPNWTENPRIENYVIFND